MPHRPVCERALDAIRHGGRVSAGIGRRVRFRVPSRPRGSRTTALHRVAGRSGQQRPPGHRPRSGDVRGVAVTRLIYVAVRDDSWNTIPPETSGVSVEARERSFEVSFSARHLTDDLDFDGTAASRATPTACSPTRWRARLHGRFATGGSGCASFISRRCTKAPPSERSARPASPRAPSRARSSRSRSWTAWTVPAVGLFRELEVDLPSGITARFSFEGDEFELEDQRNWTDAPSSRPTPRRSAGVSLTRRSRARGCASG